MKKKKNEVFGNHKIQKLIPKRKNLKISEMRNLGFQDHFNAYFNPKVDLEKKLEPPTFEKKKFFFQKKLQKNFIFIAYSTMWVVIAV